MNLLLHGIGGESEEDLPVVTKDVMTFAQPTMIASMTDDARSVTK